ncbi:MAG: ribosome biogenesis GTPase YlqF [Defluviitaleaceae bacterium]|nr:ribosome biogenesis GTPase YlqF [Defluviitaleaceae bacterium]
MVQWYPGHMAKSMRMMAEQISLVDVVIELLDARVAYSSKNPAIDSLAANKKRIVVLNKADLADPAVTKRWAAHYGSAGHTVIASDALSKKTAAAITDAAHAALSEKIEREKLRGKKTAIRAMIAGIPNVGKSTLINTLAGQAKTETADRPGVTRGKQWIKVSAGFDVLDTPGVLWPKTDGRASGVLLAATGAIRDDAYDIVSVCGEFLNILAEIKKDALLARYKLAEPPPDGLWLEALCKSRGFILKGGIPDIKRAAAAALDEFRAGKLGRISLEAPPKIQS